MNLKANPYVGPRSFETGEKLYGRDSELRTLMALLIAERIVLMHSPSGAGKTSLLKAGLIPKLQDEEFNVLPVARVNIELPKEAAGANRYLVSTLISLEEGFPQADRLPISELAALSLDAYLNKRAQEKDTLLVLDQFEEVLTVANTDRDGKIAFFNELGEAFRNKKRWVLFSMREDFLGMLSPYVRPIPNRLATRFRLDLLGANSATQAIQLPAEGAGVNFTNEAAQKLVDDLRTVQVQMPDGTIESQLGPYVEPVQLQVVCFRLWESLGPDEKEVRNEDLAKVGDVNQSLAEYYAQCITKVAGDHETPERSIREWFDHRLITPDGLRGQVRMGQEFSEELPNSVVNQLENAHIIRAEKRAGQTWLELAHDRLIQPVRSDNQKWFSANLSLFQRQTGLWLEKGRSEGLLLRGKELEQAEKEAAQISLTQDEQDYMQACRLQRRRANREQLLRRGITAGFIASVILFFVAVYFEINATNANQSFVRAANTAQAASTQAIMERANAQAASTQAFQQKGIALEQQATAQAASTLAIQQQAAAQAAATQAISSANAAATARAQSEIEKANALEQKRQAEANGLVAQSLLQQVKVRDDLANLLAVEAFRTYDMTRTRQQMLSTVYSRGRLPLAQSNSLSIIPNIDFTSDSTGLVSSNFVGCDKDNFFLCAGLIKSWKIQRVTQTGNISSINLSSDTNRNIYPTNMLDAITLSPDGTTIAAATCIPAKNTQICSQENIQLWDIKSHKTTGRPMIFVGDNANDKKAQLAYSPDGKILVLALNIPTIFNPGSTPKPIVILWNMETYSQAGQITPEKGLAAIAISPDSKTLALASGTTISLVDIASIASTILPISGNSKPLLSLAYSPDGKYLAVGGEDGSISMIDLGTKQVVSPLMTNISKVFALAFSPDGKILAAGYLDAGVILWDVASRQRLITKAMYKHVEIPDKFPIYDLKFSPDGKILASTSNELILWDTDPDSWAAKACSIAGRNFSKDEWNLFFPDQPYRTSCPQFPEGK